MILCPLQYPKTSNTVFCINIDSWLIHNFCAPYNKWFTMLMEVSTWNEVNETPQNILRVGHINDNLDF